MKNVLKKMNGRGKHCFFILTCLIVFPLLAFKDKCNTEELSTSAVKKLGKYTFLKDYKISMKRKKSLSPEDYQYFTIPVNRGSKYKFVALSSPELEGKLVINLYNSPKKEFVFATTLSQRTREVKESIEFNCETTGNFCIGYYYLDGKEGCGVAVSAVQSN